MRSAPAAARIGARETAVADAAIPRDDGHHHEDGDLRRQQQWIGQEPRVPGVHVRQPARLQQQRLELADHARGEQRHAAPQQRGGAAGRGSRAPLLHANNPRRWRYQSLWKTPLRIPAPFRREEFADGRVGGLDLLGAREAVIGQEVAAAVPQRMIDQPAEMARRRARCPAGGDRCAG